MTAARDLLGAAALLLAASCARPAPVPSPPFRPAAERGEEGLLAGAACVDLTPSRPVPLGGYGARYGAAFTAVHDRPAARALVLQSGGRSFAIVSADLLVIPGALRAAVLARVEDLRLDGLLLAATHTHSGPGGYWDNWLAEIAGMGDHDPEWASALADRIARAVREASGLARPAALRWATGDAPDLVRNRRFADGPADSSLLLAVVENRVGGSAPIATLLGFGAHPTVLGSENRLLSGDFPGVARRLFEEEAGAPALLLNGASGDLAPVVPGGGEGFQGTDRLGRALAERFRGMRAVLSAPVGAGLAVCERRVRLPGVNTRGAVGPIFRVLLDPLARTFTPAETIVQAARVGDLSIAAFPCDLGSGPGLALREHFPGPLLLVSYANDYVGYVVDDRSYARGGYEASMSFYGPGLADLLVGEARLALEATAPVRSATASGSGGGGRRSRPRRRRGTGSGSPSPARS